MKVKVWVDTQAEVDVSFDDVFAALEDLPGSERLAAALCGINAAHGVLRRVTAASIEQMSAKQRELIGAALQEQAARYLPPAIPK